MNDFLQRKENASLQNHDFYDFGLLSKIYNDFIVIWNNCNLINLLPFIVHCTVVQLEMYI